MTKNYKSFSLSEALMTLLLIAAVVVMTTPPLIHKQKKKEIIQHGIWECRLEGAAHIVTKRLRDGTLKDPPQNSGNSCTFSPPKGAKDFHVDICGGAPLTACSDEDGTHTYMFYPTLPKVKNITIGTDSVKFGDYCYAFTKGAGGRVLIIY